MEKHDYGVIGQNHGRKSYFRATIIRADGPRQALDDFDFKYPDFEVIEIKLLQLDDEDGRSLN